MLKHVPIPPRHLGDYAAVVGAEVIEGLRRRAEPFRGARLLHINSTAFGGGVAELLYTQVPLYRDLGIDAEWRVIDGDEEFFTVTKAIHNGLQGADVVWTERMEQIYREVNEDNAKIYDGKYDFVVVHDPQPAGLLPILFEHVGHPAGRWIWRCHIDLTAPHPPVWDFLRPMLEPYDAAIFTMRDFVPADMAGPQIVLIPPSIDPLSLKNIPVDDEIVAEVERRYGIDLARPILVQVSRFDPWKDPLGVIDAYRLVKEEIPGVQLVMVASMATDDPEGWHYFRKTDEHRANDPDILLLSNFQDVGALVVNAIQRSADVIIQKSLREGFGLVVSEGLWKRKPVVGGDVGGIRLQIKDGEDGFLVGTVEECARRTVELLKDPERAHEMGRAGRALVRERYLSTRSISDYLDLFASLSM